MNRHFRDARYYLKRAGETAWKGVTEEMDPVEQRVRRFVGKETVAEPGRLDRVKDDIRSIQHRAEDEATSVVGEARQKVESYRRTEA